MNLKTIITGFIVVIIALASVYFLMYDQEPDLRSKCCAECRQAFSQSPVGVGAEGVQCGAFTSAQPMSQACLDYFKENPSTVADCEN